MIPVDSYIGDEEPTQLVNSIPDIDNAVDCPKAEYEYMDELPHAEELNTHVEHWLEMENLL